MANSEHIKILENGVRYWNDWRENNPMVDPDFRDLNYIELCNLDLRGANFIRADFSGAYLRNKDLREAKINGANLKGAILAHSALNMANLARADLTKVDLTGADLQIANLGGASLHRACLSKADLRGTNLTKADLSGANLAGANLSEAHLSGSNLKKADLNGADLRKADLSGSNLKKANLSAAKLNWADLSGSKLNWADLSRAELSNADLRVSTLVETNLEGAILTGCNIYGISAWKLNLKNATQKDLVITPSGESVITVDGLEVAQFIYLLLNNQKIRDVIETVAKKVVLILGRFTPERKAILEAIKEELRKRGYLPVLFDFEGPISRTKGETVSTIAHMARFVIADITDAKSISAELERIVKILPSVPVMPLIFEFDKEYALFEDIEEFQWVFKPLQYKTLQQLLASFKDEIIEPASNMANEIQLKRLQKRNKEGMHGIN
jgi:uncharacterized protein YjbI with pentapeptide repeats